MPLRIILFLFAVISGLLVLAIFLPFYDALDFSAAPNYTLLTIILGMMGIFIVTLLAALAITILRYKKETQEYWV